MVWPFAEAFRLKPLHTTASRIITLAADLSMIGSMVSATLRTEPACDGESPRSPNYLVRLELEDGTMEDIVMPAFHDLHPELEPGARILVGTRVVKDTRIGLGFLVDDTTHQLPTRARVPLQVDSARLAAGAATRTNCASDLSDSDFEKYAFGMSEDCTTHQDDAAPSITVTDDQL